MATNFPTSLDSLTNPTASDPLNNPSHSDQHANVNDAVEALEAKVGVDGSAVTTSLDYKVAQTAPKDAQYVTLATDSTLTNERVLTAGTGITVTDAGAGGNVTVATSAILPTTVDAKGDLLVGSANDTVTRLAAGSNGDTLLSDSTATNGLRWQGQQIAGKNKIINGNMQIAQRGTSFTSTGSANNDDKYTLDRWYILSDGNDAIDVTQATDAPTGGLNSIALDVETINKKFGIAQIIEQRNCIGLIGQTVTLSFWAKVSSTTKLDNVKAGIVAWSGTADTVTSDIISAWGAEGTNPTLIANATFENTPANLGVTTSWARYTITAAVDTASTKNIIVFIWSDVTDTTAGDFLYVTDVQLEFGSVATKFTTNAGTFNGELRVCERYYCKSFHLGTTPANNQGSGQEGYFFKSTFGNDYSQPIQFPSRMRAAPTITLYNPGSGTANAWPTYDTAGIVSTGDTGVVAGNINERSFRVSKSSSTTLSFADGQWTAEIEL